MMISRYRGRVTENRVTSIPTGSDRGMGAAPQIHLIASIPMRTTA